jgi:hypothetical protein
MLTHDVANLVSQYEHDLIDAECLEPLGVDVYLTALIDSCCLDALVFDELALHEHGSKEGMLCHDGHFSFV